MHLEARRVALATALEVLVGSSAAAVPCTPDGLLRVVELPQERHFDLLDFKGKYARSAPQQGGPPTIKVPVSALEAIEDGEAERSGQGKMTVTHSHRKRARWTVACACCPKHAAPPAGSKPAVLEELEQLDPKSKKRFRGKAKTRPSLKGASRARETRACTLTTHACRR